MIPCEMRVLCSSILIFLIHASSDYPRTLSETAYTILVEGTISNGPNGGKVIVKSNKSIVGIGSTAFLNGIGLDIKDVSNIILQNLRITLAGVTASGPSIQVNGGDAIGISGSRKNIWIDHCEFFSEDPSKQTSIDLYDGLIDIKGPSGFITSQGRIGGRL